MQSTTTYLLLLCLIASTMAQNATVRVPPCTPNKPCGICEARDCDSDDDCKKNFICADQHKAQLLKRGLNQFKGRCNNTIPSGWEVCIPPKWLVPAKKECEVDCDADFDCREGLLCAEKHFDEILAAGYSDKRKAYCTKFGTGGANGGNQGPIERIEVCYDPKKLIALSNKTKVKQIYNETDEETIFVP